MNTFRLISMTDFVFLMRENKEKDNIRRFWACERYAKFLKQPLTLGMFVPCDEDGSVLEEPPLVQTAPNEDVALECIDYIEQYQQAKERVLFKEDIPLDAIKHHISQGRTIEYFTRSFTLTLTESAIKQIGL